jgi:hypothetical protein
MNTETVSPETLLLKSERFLKWGERNRHLSYLQADGVIVNAEVTVRHFSPAQLAKAWGVSIEKSAPSSATNPAF